MTTNLTTVNIKKEFQKELRKMSESWGMSQVEFLNNAIWYFKKTGINPQSPHFSLKEEIAKLENRLDQVIKFLRHMEKEKLSPLLDEIIISDRRLKDSLALSIDKRDIESIKDLLIKIDKLINNQEEINQKYFYFLAEIIEQKIEEQLKEKRL